MSKEIKEKCKECYYNEEILGCMLIKCDYRKATKDLKIIRLNNKIVVLEAKLAEKEKEKEDWKRVFEELALDSIDHESFNATVDEYEKEIEELKIYQNQTAIAELEKVKEYNRGLVYSSSLIDKFIDQQIKSLKGEK